MKEEADQKREQLKQIREEYEQSAKKREEEQLRRLKKQTELRAFKKAEIDKTNAKREAKLKLREADWKMRANEKIKLLVEKHKEDNEKIADLLDEARQAKNDKAAKEALQRLRIKEDNQELEKEREANLEKRALQTELRAIQRVDQIKAEAQE